MTAPETEIKIVQAIKADRAQLAGLAATVFYETFADTMPEVDLELYIEDAFNVRQISREIEDERNIFLLTFHHDHLLAYAKLNSAKPPISLANEHEIELERLYVLKAHRAKQIGALLSKKPWTLL